MTGTRRATFTEMPGKALDVMQDFDVSRLGYEETEYRVDGTALSYELKGERGDDGKWEVTEGQTAPFRTRIVVRRPADPDSFSGTVVVEWHNVSAGIDAAPDWGFVHRHLAARGHAFVGVSAQKAGIDGGGIVAGGPALHLKVLAPERYADLAHPGDAWAFDMFTQVAELLRGTGTENPLGGLEPERLIAAGESQSAAALVTYINAVDPHTRVFDGYFVHGRPGAGLAIDGVFLPSAARVGVGRTGISDTAIEIASRGERLRDDVRVPVLVLQSETDVIVLGSGRAEQPDSDRVRLWEIAGAAHADTYTVSGSRHDDGTVGGARLAELLRPTRSLLIGNTEKAVNSGPQQHYVAQAAIEALGRLGGRRAAPAPRAAAGPDRRRDRALRARRERQRPRRHPHALGRRADGGVVGARPDRRVLRLPLRHHGAFRPGRRWRRCTRAATPSTSSASRRHWTPPSRPGSCWRRTAPKSSRSPSTRSRW